MKLIIGNKNYSSWSLRPWLLLATHKLAFDEERIPLDEPDTKARILEASEAGKVPVLKDGDLTVWDSLAICEYVSEKYLDGRGWPQDLAARAEARAVSAEMHSGLFAIRGQMPMNCRATGRRVPMTPELENEIARVDRLWSDCRAKYSAGGPWLFGDFSIADCMFAPVTSRFATYGVSLSDRAREYQQQVLNSAPMQDWIRAGSEETEIVQADEAGA
ncbi:glutathione S-transferase family protein [Marinobacter confluentis]|uniref:Glutathione S-transferase family protein n=1 Tax=Marinobacter confluentis TaxID=1697557 RepID=A0A4Z1C7C8_9GAMM|nr:glutathione S-transferase family protein [Marinobacter confluentis]TGN39305.1 glutathione S-transferase family protein [Marinobacter confluentis]